MVRLVHERERRVWKVANMKLLGSFTTPTEAQFVQEAGEGSGQRRPVKLLSDHLLDRPINGLVAF